MTTENLHTFRKLAQNTDGKETIQAASDAFAKLHARLTESNASELLLLAVHLHPNATPLKAVQLFSDACDVHFENMKRLGVSYKEAKRSELMRLEPFDAEVAQRESEINSSIQHSSNVRSSALSKIESESNTRKKLQDQGLSEDQITLVNEISLKPHEIEQIYTASVEPLIRERQLLADYRRTLNELALPEVVLERVKAKQLKNTPVGIQ